MASMYDDYERRIISFSIPVDVLSRLDTYAKKIHINRSAAITSLLVQALDQSSAIEIMSKLMDKYESLEEARKNQDEQQEDNVG